jgi:lanosterol synthase
MRNEFKHVFRAANDFVDLTQIRVDHPEHARFYRDATKGGWPFSTRDMGWVVADCTGEGETANKSV